MVVEVLRGAARRASVEAERISESQRFQGKLLFERSQERSVRSMTLRTPSTVAISSTLTP